MYTPEGGGGVEGVTQSCSKKFEFLDFSFFPLTWDHMRVKAATDVSSENIR